MRMPSIYRWFQPDTHTHGEKGVSSFARRMFYPNLMITLPLSRHTDTSRPVAAQSSGLEQPIHFGLHLDLDKCGTYAHSNS